MKKLISTLLLILSYNLIRSQNLPFATSQINAAFSTGVQAAWPWLAQNIGTPDPNWLVNGGPAISVSGGPGNCVMAIPGAVGSPNAQWITFPPSGGTGAGMNINGAIFTHTFYIPVNQTFYLNLDIRAPGWIEEVLVNGDLEYKRYGAVLSGTNILDVPSIWGIGSGGFGMIFKWCRKNFSLTTNTITIITKNLPSSSQQNGCNFTGLLVSSFSPVGQNYPITIGTPTLCLGTQYTFAVPNSTYTQGSNLQWVKPTAIWGNTLITSPWPSGPTTFTQLTTLATISPTNVPNGGIISNYYYTSYHMPSSSLNPFFGQWKMYQTCEATSAYSVTVVPPLTITPTSTTICRGYTLQLTANGATSYTWYAPPSLTNIGSPLPSVTVTPTVSATYTVKGLTASGGCLYTKTLSVNVLPSPTVNVVPSSTAVCLGNPVSFVPSGAASYSYWPGPPITGLTAQFTPLVPTTYTISGKNANGCINTKTVSIVVNQNPTVTALANPTIICPGSPATITASGASTYFWPQTFAITSAITVTPNVTTVYQAIGTATNGCSKTATVQMVVMTTPTVVISPPMICAGMANTLTASGASNYTWTFGSGTNQVTYANTPSVVITLTSTTNYTLCGMGPLNNCSACVNGTLKPGNPIPLSVANVTWCTNATNNATITVNSSLNAPINYTWTPGSPSPLIGQTQTVAPTVNSVYMVSATSPSGCPNSAILKVDIITNCCPNNTVGLTSLLNQGPNLTGWYQNNSYILDGNITVNGMANFQNAEVWMTPGVKITVLPGATLELDKTHLYACGLNMWQGIEVLDGGRITTPIINSRSYSSLIEDAEIAIDLDNISLNNSGITTPPIEIYRIIFNKNYIGIKISNGDPALDSLALGITGCIFTSRTLPFTSFPNLQLTWPHSDITNLPGSLRATINPTIGLQHPYSVISTTYPWSNMLAPHSNTYSQIGIKIENMGDPYSVASSPGVQWGVTYKGPITNDFNLFLSIGTGVEVINASITTKCNVFAKMFGNYGIRHQITPNVLMNARLALKSSDIAGGNQFWDCGTGVLASNVYDCWIDNSLFRSTHDAQYAALGVNTPFHIWGDTGISINTNRFVFTVRNSQFNNIRNGIVFTTPSTPQNYDIGNGLTSGIMATNIGIDQNYFGPEVLSTTPYSGNATNPIEYSSDAIQIITPIVLGWVNNPNQSGLSWITSNKIDRTYRGIFVDGFANMPTTITGNSVNIENDYVFNNPAGNSFPPAFGFGIAVQNNLDNMGITENTLSAQGSLTSPSVSLVYCENNYGTVSPLVKCNHTKFAHFGFEFSGSNASTKWFKNYMCEEWAGLALTNNGVIGVQGSPTGSASLNQWELNCAQWNTQFALYQTYSENSDPTQSFLWTRAQNSDKPIWHNAVGNSPNGPYLNAPTANYSTDVGGWGEPSCNDYTTWVPNWRIANSITVTAVLEGKLSDDVLKLYPNPTNDILNIDNITQSDNIILKIIDITGKVVITEKISNSSTAQLNVAHLAQGLYLLEITNGSKSISRKKFVKTN